MVIIKIKGGLGNQMLQYACYLALKQRYPQMKIAADVSFYNISPVHNGLELERVFPVDLNVFIGRKKTGNKIISKYWYGVLSKINVALFKSGFLSKLKYVGETNEFNPELFSLSKTKHYYLDGYWGSEKYFGNVFNILHEQLKFKKVLDEANELIANQIANTNSVGVHIRRGDYLNAANGFLDLSATEYYDNAVAAINQRIPSPFFYIFSDDAQWCRENIGWIKHHEHYFIQGNKGRDSYKDMQLMSLCKHNITANSTFSWWAAWLNKNEDKVVIAPKHLFVNEQKNAKVVSIYYPEKWILV
jgi:hypothetical protein